MGARQVSLGESPVIATTSHHVQEQNGAASDRGAAFPYSPPLLPSGGAITFSASPRKGLAAESLASSCSVASKVFNFPQIPEISGRAQEMSAALTILEGKFAQLYARSETHYESLFPRPAEPSQEKSKEQVQEIFKGMTLPPRLEDLDAEYRTLAADYQQIFKAVGSLLTALEPEAIMPKEHRKTRKALTEHVNKVSLLCLKVKLLLEHLTLIEEIVPAQKILQDKLVNKMRKAVQEEIYSREAVEAGWDEAIAEKLGLQVDKFKQEFAMFQDQVGIHRSEIVQPNYAKLAKSVEGYPHRKYLSSFVINEDYSYSLKSQVTNSLRVEIDAANRLRSQSRDNVRSLWAVLYAESLDYTTELNRLILATSDGKLPARATVSGFGKKFADAFRKRADVEKQVTLSIPESFTVASEASSSSQASGSVNLSASMTNLYSTKGGEE